MKRKSVPLLLVMGLFFALNSNPIAAQKQKKSQLAKEGRTIEEWLGYTICYRGPQ